MKKRILSILSLLFVLLFAFACDPTTPPEVDPENPPTPPTVTVESIAVSGQQTLFYYGDAFTTGDMVVTATLSDGSTKILSADEYVVDSSYVNTRKINRYLVDVATVDGKATTSYVVTVLNKIMSIRISGGPFTFRVGEPFSAKNLTVTAIYADDTSGSLSASDYVLDSSAYNPDEPGTYLIYVKHIASEITDSYAVTVAETNSLNLLMIGNSFSDDTIEYAYKIAASVGITEIRLGNLYIGGCSLDRHLQNAQNDATAYEYRTYQNGKWVTAYNRSLYSALAYNDWDYISLQQASGASGVSASYGALDALTSYVKTNSKNKNAELVWNMTWAYQSDSNHSDFPTYNRNQTQMYNAIVNAVQTQIVPRSFAAIVPAGTAIQNARTSYLGDTLTRDGYHLSMDMGRYIAGLTLVGKLTGKDISSVAFAPSGVSADMKKIAVESAKNAIDRPFEVTKSSFDKAPELDLTGLKELDYKPVGGAFWDATQANGYNKYVTTNLSLSRCFVATPRFTKEQLPVGSVITLASGWQYRPEGWIGDVQQASRPAITTSPTVEITESWWANYTHRAFNVAKVGTPSLAGQYEQIRSVFKIYVPTSTVLPEENPAKAADEALMQGKVNDVSKMTFKKWVPVNGYYNSSSGSSFGIEYLSTEDGKLLHTKYIATPVFTKTDLPVGSVIIVDSGWQYRPDGYTPSGKPSVRPAVTAQNVVVVDESWWGDMDKRGFNIFTTDSAVINQTPYEAYAHFRIYVPA